MKFRYIVMLAAIISCSSKIGSSQVQGNNTVLTFSKDINLSTFDLKKSRYYLDIETKSLQSGNCNFGFRVFLSIGGNKIDTSKNSANYLASYMLGESCKAIFRTPLNKHLNLQGDNPLRVKLTFQIVPIDIHGNQLNLNLNDKLDLSVQQQ